MFEIKLPSFYRKEIKLIRWKTGILATFESLFVSSQLIAAFISLVSLAATGTELTSYNTFIILSLVSTLRTPVAWNVAVAMSLLADFAAALSRIESLLEFENGNIRKYLQDTFAKSGNSKSGKDSFHEAENFPLPCAITDLEKKSASSTDKHLAVLLKNVVCSWIGNWKMLTLKTLCLSAEKGDLVLITGPVGCGKSSLLYVILKEIALLSGYISIRGKIAWVGQQPWVFSGTIRENILFGEAFDPHRYRMVLNACVLYNDLQRFPDGDMTRVGERGIVLSGGQRARVELARAAYSNADIYLLDDPLSAVDTKVGHYIFTACIKRLLHGKTRLLVTHNLQALRDAKNIVLLKNGAVLSKGDATSLFQSGDLSWIGEDVGSKEAVVLPNKSPLSEHQSESETHVDESFASLDHVDEDREIGSISWKVYWHYIQAGMYPVLVALIVIFFFFVQG